MNEILVVLVTATMFVVLGLLTRERAADDDPCSGCELECSPKEVHDATS